MIVVKASDSKAPRNTSAYDPIVIQRKSRLNRPGSGERVRATSIASSLEPVGEEYVPLASDNTGAYGYFAFCRRACLYSFALARRVEHRAACFTIARRARQ